MSDQVRIVQRNLHPHTNAIQSLTITAAYGDGTQLDEATMLLRAAIPNEDHSIRAEIEKLGSALIAAARSPNGITS